MLLKIVSLFLAGMAILAIFGRLRMPQIGFKTSLGSKKKCKTCGAPRVGKGDCPCGAKI